MKWQSISSGSIIVICSVAGAILIFVLSVYSSYEASSPPVALPPVPGEVDKFYHIETVDFLEADPFILTKDGQLFGAGWRPEGYLWRQVDLPLTLVDTGKPCTRRQIRAIEAAASAVVECRIVQTVAEWCPGPRVSFAITDEGEVWKMENPAPYCITWFFIGLFYFVPGGFVIGLAIVGVRWVVRAIKSRRDI